MTNPKQRLDRTPQWVDRETGAAELCISPSTWDEWVKAGLLPRPRMLGISGTTARWAWSEVAARLAGEEQSTPEPFFRVDRAETKDRKRGIA